MDRRIQKTQKAIQEAFLTLLGKKHISKITVAEISELADLGRGTFYLYYRDIYELYEYIENTLYHELELLLDKVCSGSHKEDLNILIKAVTEYIVNNRQTFLLLIGAGSSGRNLYKLKKLFYKKLVQEDPRYKKSEYRSIECMFIASGIIGVLEEWLFNKQKLPKKQIDESIYKILRMFE